MNEKRDIFRSENYGKNGNFRLEIDNNWKF